MINSFPQNSPFQPKSVAKKPIAHHQNFIEALKSVGSSVTKAVNPDKSPKNSFNNYDSQNNQFQNNEWQRNQERNQENILARRLRHKEVIEGTKLFDRKEEEVKKQINALRDEIKKLAQDLAGLGKDIERVIDDEIVNPGTYHLNFFEKLRAIIVLLRKRVSESSNWMEISSQRKQQQRHYWGQVKKSGTKFMLSSERSMVTQTG